MKKIMILAAGAIAAGLAFAAPSQAQPINALHSDIVVETGDTKLVHKAGFKRHHGFKKVYKRGFRHGFKKRGFRYGYNRGYHKRRSIHRGFHHKKYSRLHHRKFGKFHHGKFRKFY